MEKIIQNTKTKKLLEICQKISDAPFDQRSLIHGEACFPGGPRISENPFSLKNGKKSQKTQKLKNV